MESALNQARKIIRYLNLEINYILILKIIYSLKTAL